MDTLLAKATPAEILTEPFPHLVVPDAMPADLYRRFTERMPDYRTVVADADPPSNRRYPCSANRILVDDRLNPLWREFCRVHTGPAFFNAVLDLFRDHIPADNPGLARWLAAHPAPRFGLLNEDGFETADVLCDARLEINTPVREASSVRRGHLDLPNRVFSGLFYMRSPDDESVGGDLDLLRWKTGTPAGIDRFQIPDEELEIVKTVPYAANVFVLFVNPPHALHGVTVRQPTAAQRQYFFLTAEVAGDLF